MYLSLRGAPEKLRIPMQPVGGDEHLHKTPQAEEGAP